MRGLREALKRSKSPGSGSRFAISVDRLVPDPLDGLAEAQLEYERLRLWLTTQPVERPPIHTVMVASCQRGNGATTTVTGLAAALTRWPSTPVLLVDANLRTPRLERLFGAAGRRGLREFLANGHGAGDHDGVTDCVHATGRPNLFVMPTGRSPAWSVDTLPPARLALLVSELKSRFEFTVFDVPPLLEFPDGYALAPHVDVVVVVVEAERTLVDDARRVLWELERAGGRAAGVVLNRQRNHLPRFFRRLLRPAVSNNPA